VALEVIGAGYGRNGTLSMKLALEQLGFGPCYHMIEVFERPEHSALWHDFARGRTVDFEALFDGFRATVDWPACNAWRELAERYPQARVILSERDPAAWYRSVMNTIYQGSQQSLASDDPLRRAHGEMVFALIWDGIFDGRMDDEAHVIACYEAHNARVKAEIPAERLLVYQVGSGWEPLCDFLDVPVPDMPYPSVNSTEDFRRNLLEDGQASSAQDP